MSVVSNLHACPSFPFSLVHRFLPSAFSPEVVGDLCEKDASTLLSEGVSFSDTKCSWKGGPLRPLNENQIDAEIDQKCCRGRPKSGGEVDEYEYLYRDLFASTRTKDYVGVPGGVVVPSGNTTCDVGIPINPVKVLATEGESGCFSREIETDYNYGGKNVRPPDLDEVGFLRSNGRVTTEVSADGKRLLKVSDCKRLCSAMGDECAGFQVFDARKELTESRPANDDLVHSCSFLRCTSADPGIDHSGTSRSTTATFVKKRENAGPWEEVATTEGVETIDYRSR